MARKNRKPGRPQRTNSTRTHLYLNDMVLDVVAQSARDEKRTISAQMEVLVTEAFAARGVKMPVS